MHGCRRAGNRDSHTNTHRVAMWCAGVLENRLTSTYHCQTPKSPGTNGAQGERVRVRVRGRVRVRRRVKDILIWV